VKSPSKPAQKQDPLELFTVAQVAAILRVSTSTIRRLVDSGELIAVDVTALGNRRHKRIEPSEVERYKRRNRL
jgi:excisionase family DNA binding protein